MARLIEVTRHALERYKERWPNDLDREALRQLIAGEVQDAMVDGRLSTKLPRWAVRPGTSDRTLYRNGRERDRTLRAVWTSDLSRLYLVDKHGETIRVVTSVLPSE